MIKQPCRRLAAVATACALVALTAPAFAHEVVVREDGRTTVTREAGKTTVNAPRTKVVTKRDGNRTKVDVRAPYTGVNVDTARRHVRIRVPYYSGDVYW